MQVETFEIVEPCHPEVTADDVDAEARGLIDTLGLTGQQRLMTPPDVDGGQTRIPYRRITSVES